MLTKVISGGQTGVDRAGLAAAQGAGLATGGWMPKGFRCLDGDGRAVAQRYGMVETPAFNYAIRTHCNARGADATLRIAADFQSGGEQTTRRAILAAGTPWFDIKLEWDRGQYRWTDSRWSLRGPCGAGDLEVVAYWLQQCRVRTLNVAGNSEQTAPGIGEWAEAQLRLLFRWVRGQLDSAYSVADNA
jgi:hypothetical protein